MNIISEKNNFSVYRVTFFRKYKGGQSCGVCVAGLLVSEEAVERPAGFPAALGRHISNRDSKVPVSLCQEQVSFLWSTGQQTHLSMLAED